MTEKFRGYFARQKGRMDQERAVLGRVSEVGSQIGVSGNNETSLGGCECNCPQCDRGAHCHNHSRGCRV